MAFCRISWIALTALVLWAIPGLAKEFRVQSILSAVDYLKGTDRWRQDGLRVGVVSVRHLKASKEQGRTLVELLRERQEQRVLGAPITVEPISMNDGSELLPVMRTKKLNALFLSPDLGEFLTPVLQTARQAGLLVFGSELDQLRAGATLGVIVQAGKPRIVVNPGELKSLGLQMDSRLLRMALVVQTSAAVGRQPPPAGKVGPAQKATYLPPEEMLALRLRGVEPPYPPAARGAAVGAHLMVKIHVSAQGRVSGMQFLKTHAAFEDTVRETVSRWTFKPHLSHGRPTPFYTVAKFEFVPD